MKWESGFVDGIANRSVADECTIPTGLDARAGAELVHGLTSSPGHSVRADQSLRLARYRRNQGELTWYVDFQSTDLQAIATTWKRVLLAGTLSEALF